jgi:hypothetical protein
MSQVFSLIPLHSAIAELELSAAMLLLAEQEEGSIYEALGRLHRALKAVRDARELADELSAATGRPILRVLDGGPSPLSAPRGSMSNCLGQARCAVGDAIGGQRPRADN